MSILSNQNYPKKTPLYSCNNCLFFTSNKKDYNRHTDTIKHKSIVCQGFSIELPQKTPKNPRSFTCNCGKVYNDNSGLWRHKKKYECSNDNHTTNDVVKLETEQKEDNNSPDKELIMILIKQNTELMEIVKNGTTNHIHNTTNSHNKAFNLNFFLNETCKDAMNITDFVDSIKLQLSDLEKVGELGYVQGISNIIVKNLNALDETARPVHCTDKKRETIYIKDQGQWEKDDDNKSKLKKTINKIANKNIKLISQFREKYPECKKCESSISDKYNKMIIEAMGGLGDNNVEKEEKIIRNIAKEVIINK